MKSILRPEWILHKFLLVKSVYDDEDEYSDSLILVIYAYAYIYGWFATEY